MPELGNIAAATPFAWSKWTVTVFCLVFFAINSFTQIFLSVRNNHRPAQKKYFPGDEILFRVDGEKLLYRGTLDAVYDSSVVIDGIHLEMARISAIVRTIGISRGLTYGAWSAIPFFLAVTALNRGINLEESPLIDNPTWRLSGVFAGIGAVPLLFRKKVYRMGNKWSLKRIDINP